mgnify:FL=1
MRPLLSVRQLCVDFAGAPAVEAWDLDLQPAETVALVGESGSGKTLAMMALMGLVDPPGRVRAERMHFDGRDLLSLSPKERRWRLGRSVGVVFQDPTQSLNPCYRVGDQLKEVLRVHMGLQGLALHQRAIELFEAVEIANVQSRLRAYPHELSGGLNQRVMLAMALACQPKLLIADEPTTALDVTTQAQVMKLLARLQQDHGMAMVLISHDLAVVAHHVERVCVMYAGQMIEAGSPEQLFSQPRHPYTAALLQALPEHAAGTQRLRALPGRVPGLNDRPHGCLFAPRCDRVQPSCTQSRPAWTDNIRCFSPLPIQSCPSADIC